MVEDQLFETPYLAEEYDSGRPSPPAVACEVLCELAETARPKLVVDLGSGTGLSTRVWAPFAERIVGIEPADPLRRQAASATTAPNVSYRAGFAEQTDLTPGSVDIVACVQSFHWMDTNAVLTEAHRVLRNGGVFATLDCDLPPFIHWRLTGPWTQLHEDARAMLAAAHEPVGERVPKDEHLGKLQASGHFRFTREFLFHSREQASAERVMQQVRSRGAVAALLREGSLAIQERLTRFEHELRTLLAGQPARLTYLYRMRAGVK